MKKTYRTASIVGCLLILQTFQLIGQQNNNDQISTVDSLINIGNKFSRNRLLDSTIHYYTLAARQALQEGDTLDYLGLRVTAAIEYGQWGKFDLTYQMLDSVIAVEEDREVSNPKFEALYFKSNVLISQRRFDEALISIAKGREVNFDIKAKTGIVRRARLSLLEAFSYVQINQLEKSEQFFEEGIHIYDSLGMVLQLAEVLNHYAELKSARLKADEAIKYFDWAKRIHEEYPYADNSYLASLYTNMARAYTYLGLNRNAVASYEKADVLLSSTAKQNLNLAEINVGLAEAYISLGEYENALSAIQKAIPIAQLNFGEKSDYTLSAQYLLGNILKEMGQYDKAYNILSKGISLFAEDLSNESRNVLARYTYEKGAVAINLGRSEEGLELMRSSIEVSLSSGSNFENSTINLYQGLAEVYLQLSQPDSAAFYFEQVLKVGDREYGTIKESALQVYHEKTYEALMGRVFAFDLKYKQQNDIQWLDSAYLMLTKAEDKLSQFREFPSDISKKLEIGEDISNSLQAGISVCYELFNITKDRRYADHAYGLIEKSKSNQALFDFPVEQLTNESVPDSVLNHEKNLNAAISTLETLLYQELTKTQPDSAAVAKYQEQIIEFTDDLLLLKYEIGQNFPAYFRLKYNRQYATIATTQSDLITENEVLINYHYQKEELYVFQITNTGFKFNKVGISNDFESEVKSFIDILNKPEVNTSALNYYDSLAYTIYSQLLSGIDALETKSSIIIVPDGPIHLLPFGVLTKSINNEKKDFQSLNYLIKDHSISYTTSTTMLTYQQKRKNNGKGLVAFAPFFNSEMSIPQVQTDSVRAALGNLAHSKKEVESIGGYFDSKVFLDTSATEKVFREIVGDYAVIHLASHALLDENNSLFSKILFSPHNIDSINDGALNNREILGLNISADMVVLSACNTGSGDLLPGEGVMSLANGFSYAGANSLVMTLWPANDESTANIIESFYKNLSQGIDKSEAMRNAKLTYLESSYPLLSHPYYWAHFLVNGDDRPLVKNGFPGYWWLLLLIPLAYFIISRSRNKSAA